MKWNRKKCVILLGCVERIKVGKLEAELGG